MDKSKSKKGKKTINKQELSQAQQLEIKQAFDLFDTEGSGNP